MIVSLVLHCAAVVLVLFWIYGYITYKPHNFPAGPIRLPIFGSCVEVLLTNWKFPQVAVEKWRKKYGDIFGMYVGQYLGMVICDNEAVKEALVKPEFDGKADIFLARLRALGQPIGIFFSEGPLWHEQRRFSLRHLRDFGFGRRFDRLESLMERQLNDLVEFLTYPADVPQNQDILVDGRVFFPDILYPLMTNAILSVYGTEPCEPTSDSHREYRDVGRAVMCMQRGLHNMGTIAYAPWTRYFAPETIGYSGIVASNNKLFPFIRKIVGDLRRKDDTDDSQDNFVRRYYKALEDNSGNPDTYFSEDQLLVTAIDYMFPSVTAVPATIVFLLQHLLRQPEVQDRVQKELDAVVGRGRLPTLDDRPQLPYLEATLREVMRLETLVPLGIVHKCIKDTEFRGFQVPKDTLVYTYLHGAHTDPKVYDQPQMFRPERFLDGSTGRLLKKDLSLPFGAGKRLCAGETFARNTLFLTSAALLQNFTFEPAKGSPDITDKHAGIINSLDKGLWLKFNPRH